jgi:hypothetical protein
VDHLESLIGGYDESPDFFASATIAVFDEAARVRLISAVPVDDDIPSRWLWSSAAIPSGIVHSRSLAERTGPWRDWRTIAMPPDTEFFQRMARLAGPARRTGRVTVAKVPSSWRRDSYKRRDVTPQRTIEARLRTDPTFLRDTAFGFLASQYPTTFRMLVRAMSWRIRQMIANHGARWLREVARERLFRKRFRGALVRRARRFRGLEE